MAGDADPTPPAAEPLPVPVDDADAIEPRPYLELRPADAPVDPGAITHAMESVEAMLRAATQRRLRDKLFRSTAHPAVEWLLVSDGHADPIVTPLVGCSDPDLLGELEAALRTGLPAGYELRETEYHPWALVDHCPDHAGADHPAITPPRTATGQVMRFQTNSPPPP